MKKRKKIGCFILLMLSLLSFGAVPPLVGGTAGQQNNFIIEIEWEHTFGNPDNSGGDSANSLINTSDGGYAFAGETDSYGLGNFDMWLVKTNASGHAEWNKTYGGVEWDVANALIQTADGGYALGGHTGHPNPNFLLLKTSANGTQEWNFTFGGPNWDLVYSMIQTTDKGFVMAGAGDGFYETMWLVKADANGSLIWNRTYNGSQASYANTVIQTLDGGFALAGALGEYPNLDVFLLKTDSNGIQEWNTSWKGPSFLSSEDVATSILQLSDGSFVLTGHAGLELDSDY